MRWNMPRASTASGRRAPSLVSVTLTLMNARAPEVASVAAGVEFVRTLTDQCKDAIKVEEHPGPQVQGRAALEQFVKDRCWGHHASCTCPIGRDGDRMAVLDGQFRVRGTKGLRVADASVFPRIPGFFIVTSVYMIGEKAAEVIHADTLAPDAR